MLYGKQMEQRRGRCVERDLLRHIKTLSTLAGDEDLTIRSPEALKERYSRRHDDGPMSSHASCATSSLSQDALLVLGTAGAVHD